MFTFSYCELSVYNIRSNIPGFKQHMHTEYIYIYQLILNFSDCWSYLHISFSSQMIVAIYDMKQGFSGCWGHHFKCFTVISMTCLPVTNICLTDDDVCPSHKPILLFLTWLIWLLTRITRQVSQVEQELFTPWSIWVDLCFFVG